MHILAQSPPNNQWVTVSVALIAAVTALTGAAIAAITAGSRQRRELAHDRELADVSELRAVLDEAAGNLARADRAMLEVEERRPVSDAIEKELDESQDVISDSAQRIRIRLGEGEVHTAYQKALNAQRKFRNLVLGRGQDGNEQVEISRFKQGRDEFFDAAHHIARSVTGPSSDGGSQRRWGRWGASPPGGRPLKG